jgi:NADP-dependent 3-hydroxy acid dehydrogenase YdfG
MYDQCLEIMKTADIVINNGYIRDVQARIITDLKDSGVTLITIGSISGYYPERSEYGASKRMIHDTFHQNKRYYANRCLLVVPGVMEENEQCKRINAKVIDIDQVLNGIKYFLNNRRVTLLEFDNIRAG